MTITRTRTLASIAIGALIAAPLSGVATWKILSEKYDYVMGFVNPDDLVHMRTRTPADPGPALPNKVLFVKVRISEMPTSTPITGALKPIDIAYTAIGKYTLPRGQTIKGVVDKIVLGQNLPFTWKNVVLEPE